MPQKPSPFSNHDPQRSCGFLIQDVARLMRRNFNRQVEYLKLGLTQAQWQALVHISKNEGMRQSALADILEAQPITVGRLIDRMAAKGWVERRPDPTDRRAVGLYLTDKATPLIDRMWEIAMQTRAAAMDGISEVDKEKLLDMLAHIRTNLIKTAGDKP